MDGKSKAYQSTKKSEDQFSKEESTRRFEAALRGSRVVGPQPMKNKPPKRRLKRKEKGRL